jgi:hypothetical protein
MNDEYTKPAALKPDLIHKENSCRCAELTDSLKATLAAIDVLLDDRPMLAAKLCGSTTLGNVRAGIWGVLYGRQ